MQQHEPIWVLRDLSFEARSGNALAIVGRNGSGKSTLLRLTSGTLRPSEGEVQVSGRVAALELGLRFPPSSPAGRISSWPDSCSVYRPIISRSYCLRSSLYPSWATIWNNRSAPTQAACAFSIATALRPDVLLVDEALAVGDAHFQPKCIGRIRRFLDGGSCLVFVPHDPKTVRSLCSWAVLLEGGARLREGSPATVLDYYNGLLARFDGDSDMEQEKITDCQTSTRSGEGQVVIDSIELLGDDQPLRSFPVGSPLRVRIRGRAIESVADLTVGLAIRDRLGNDVYGTNSYHLDDEARSLESREVFEAEFRLPTNLGPDEYAVTAALHAGRVHLEGSYDWWVHAVAFEVVPGPEPYFVGRAYLPVTLRFKKRGSKASPERPEAHC